MIARYNKRIKELADRPDEMFQYMIKAAEFIKVYDENKNKSDLFQKYLFEVEGEGTGPHRSEDVTVICSSCHSSNTFVDICSSDQVCEDCGYAEFVQTNERSYKEEQDNDQNIITKRKITLMSGYHSSRGRRLQIFHQRFTISSGKNSKSKRLKKWM